MYLAGKVAHGVILPQAMVVHRWYFGLGHSGPVVGQTCQSSPMSSQRGWQDGRPLATLPAAVVAVASWAGHVHNQLVGCGIRGKWISVEVHPTTVLCVASDSKGH